MKVKTGQLKAGLKRVKYQWSGIYNVVVNDLINKLVALIKTYFYS